MFLAYQNVLVNKRGPNGWRHDGHWNAHQLLETLLCIPELRDECDVLSEKFAIIIHPEAHVAASVDNGPPLECSFTFADLCCGTGIASWVLEEMEGHCVIACDVDKNCHHTYIANFPAHITVFPTACKMIDVKPARDCDLIVCGFPCQPYSSSNSSESKGLESDNGQVFFELLHKIEQLCPRVILLENVPPLLKSKDWIEIMKPALESCCREVVGSKKKICGYRVITMRLNAQQCGVPQDRNRVFIVAIRESAFSKGPMTALEKRLRTLESRKLEHQTIDDILNDGEAHGVPLSQPQINAMNMWDRLLQWAKDNDVDIPKASVIKALDENDEFLSEWKDELQDWIDEFIILGESLLDDGSKVFAKLNWVGATDVSSVWDLSWAQNGGRYIKPIRLGVATTVTTSWTLWHGPSKKFLSVSEARLFQTFPDEFSFGDLSDGIVCHQIGNAIPYRMLKMVCEAVVPILSE